MDKLVVDNEYPDGRADKANFLKRISGFALVVSAFSWYYP